MTEQEKREGVIRGLEAILEETADMFYRSTIQDALALLKALSEFKAYFDDLYGKGLEVANWHMNGATEPFDSFYDSAIEEMQHD